MKSPRRYVFVPILVARVVHTTVAISLRTDANGSSPSDQQHEDKARWRVRHRDGCETQALSNHLFWTWFVDTPRQS
jgi:hypothetical protein